MGNLSELVALFSSAFLAATLLPAQSEMLLAVMDSSGEHNSWILVAIATAGNVMGSIVNFFLGVYLIHFQHKKWFPIGQSSIEKATGVYQKYGVWTLLCAWMPIIGDPLTLVAGIFRVNFLVFLALVTIGKMVRYISIVALF